MSITTNYPKNNGRYNDMKDAHEKSINIGVSRCLLGDRVRYDGGHKRSALVTSMVEEGFDLVPVCPEVEAGMTVPRPPIRLAGDMSAPRVVYVSDPSMDITEKLRDYSDNKLNQLPPLSGFIFKKDSPSCGLYRVKVYSDNGIPERTGTGVFSGKVVAAHPLMPVEEEGRLNDPVLRENFIESVGVYHDWQELSRDGITARSLMDFHCANKMLIRSHDENSYRNLGRLVARAGNSDISRLSKRYVTELMAALKFPATRGRHANVLFHIMGYLKQCLSAYDCHEMLELIRSFRHGHVPLIVPVSLLRHHLRSNPIDYVSKQRYLTMRYRKLQGG